MRMATPAASKTTCPPWPSPAAVPPAGTNGRQPDVEANRQEVEAVGRYVYRGPEPEQETQHQGCSAKLRLPTRAVGSSIDEGGRNVKRLQLDREVMIQVDNSAAEAEVAGRQPDVKARVEQSTTQ